MTGLGFDPDLPGGLQDADLEMRDLQDAAARAERFRRAGICDHPWTGRHGGGFICHACKAVFATEKEMEASREEAREKML